MNHLNHCIICNDAKRFEMKVYDAKRILNNILNILSKYGNVYDIEIYEEEDIRHAFSFDHQHQHFMCGHCYKVNTNSLRNVETEIVDNLLRFISLAKNDKTKINNADFHLILRNLSGYYPGMYHALEREWHKIK